VNMRRCAAPACPPATFSCNSSRCFYLLMMVRSSAQTQLLKVPVRMLIRQADIRGILSRAPR